MGVDDVLLRLLAFGRGVFFFFGAGTVTPDMLTYDDVECHLRFFIDQRTNFETGEHGFVAAQLLLNCRRELSSLEKYALHVPLMQLVI